MTEDLAEKIPDWLPDRLDMAARDTIVWRKRMAGLTGESFCQSTSNNNRRLEIVEKHPLKMIHSIHGHAPRRLTSDKLDFDHRELPLHVLTLHFSVRVLDVVPE